MKKKTKIIVSILVVLVIAATAAPWIVKASAAKNASAEAAQSQTLREQAYDEIADTVANSLEDELRLRLVKAWADWQPDYEGWLAWSDSLYAPDARIKAIGGEQSFRDYQASMREQREKATMAMGPIMDFSVEDHTAIISYHMYLTSGGRTRDIIVTEHNTFEKIDGQWMVTYLNISTKKS